MTRQRIAASTWQERVVRWRSSGLTAQAFASEHGIGLERLKYWAHRLERDALHPQLMPVRIAAPIAAARLELHSRSGWGMRMDAGVDPVWLAKLLRELQ